MKKAVVLLSGGLDSTTVLGMTQANHWDCYALSFAYGQKHDAELAAAQRIARAFGVSAHHVFHLDIGQFGGSALTDPQISVPDYSDSGTVPVTYVPARNTIFLAVALGWAEILGAQDIFLGISHVDYSGYPDCRPEFLDCFNTLANLATQSGIQGKKWSVHAPLLHLSKAETIQLGVQYGIDYRDTVSCYRATSDGLACGHCDSCRLRKQGFAAAGVPDPTRYIP